MSTNIIDPAALSYDEIVADLTTFAKSYTGQNQGVKDFLESSASMVLIELLAGYAAYNSVNSLAALREAFIATAQQPGNIVDAANQLGYNVNRRSAPSFLLNITASASNNLGYRTPVGTYQGQPLVLAESLTIPAGPSQIEVFLGSWVELQIPVTETKAWNRLLIEDVTVDNDIVNLVKLSINSTPFKLTANPEDLFDIALTVSRETVASTAVSASGDYITVAQSYLQGTAVQILPVDNTSQLPSPFNADVVYYVVPIGDNTRIQFALSFSDAMLGTPRVIDITNQGANSFYIQPVPFGATASQDLVLMRTTSDGAQLIFGDGTIGVLLTAGMNVDIQYVSSAGSAALRDAVAEDFQLSIGATVVSVESFNRGSDEDPLEKIAVLAPAYYGAKRRMVTSDDHAAVLMGYSGDLISASSQQNTDGAGSYVVQLVYLFAPYPNGTPRLATNSEKLDMLAYLEPFRMVAVKLVIADPNLVLFQPRITILYSPGVVVAELTQQIILAINSFCYQLGQDFHVGSVIDAISSIDGVLRVYMQRPVSDRTLQYNEYIALDTNYFLTNLSLTQDPTSIVLVTDTTGGYQ